MAVPTEAEVYTQMMEHLRKAQECAATISHLTGLNSAQQAQAALAVLGKIRR